MDLTPLLEAAQPRIVGNAIAINNRLIPLERFAETPTHRGHIDVDSIESLVAYAEDFKSYRSRLFASRSQQKLTLIHDWNESSVEEGDGGWANHRAVMPLRITDDWRDWLAISGKAISQRHFAEFVEEHLDTIQEPSAAEMLTIVTTISGMRNVKFTNVVVLANGDRQLQWEETTDAKSAGDKRVPSEIKLRVPIFFGAEEDTTMEIKALFRYRIDNGALSFEVKLLHADKVADVAFRAIVDSVRERFKAESIDIPVTDGCITKTPLEILDQHKA
jgi:uncharacterized protein YfdQ (DUF2303 family)